MGRIFDFEGPLFSSLSRVADLLWLNLLYVICCIPIITIGPATTALYYVTLKMAKDEEGYITKSYFKSFKDNFKQAAVIWLIFLVIIVVLVCDLRIANGGELATILQSSSVSSVVLIAVGVMGVIITMTITYVFPLLAKFDNTVINTIKNAFIISIRHLPFTILLIAVNVVPWIAMAWIGNMTLLLVFIIFSLQAYINSKIFVKIFVNYLPKEEPAVDVDSIESIFDKKPEVDNENGNNAVENTEEIIEAENIR